MAKNKPPSKSSAKTGEQTSPRVAKIASKVLRDGRYSKAAKSVAGSALTQATNKKSPITQSAKKSQIAQSAKKSQIAQRTPTPKPKG